MTSSLSSRQGIVTKASSRLSVVLQECDDVLKTRIELPTNEAQRREYSKVLQQKIRKAKTIIQSEINNADCALDKYVKTADDLSPDVPRLDEILQKVKSNSEAAQELLQKARTAVTTLNEKYGNTQSLVDQLLRNAQMLRARSDRLEDQQKLYEQLFSLTSQLQLKGEHIDNSFFQKLLLGKFSEPIQRHILRQKQQLSTETWDTRTLLATAKDYIEAEIRISKQVEKHYGNINEFANSHFKKEYRPNSSIRKQSKGDVPCFYCNKSGHPAKNCDAFPSREERLEIMKKNKLCHNCGSRNHATPQCTKGNCTICSKHGHHTSICMKAVNLKNPQQSSTKPPLNAPPLKPQSTAKKIPQARINLASSINEDKETTSTTLNFTTIKGSNDTMILTGRAQVLNPATQSLESIYVLLDTGADRSFIKEELADRLQLKDMSSEELTITTFGCMKQMKKCGVTSIQMWDQNGAPHIYRVTRIPRIMETRQQCKLTKADREYLFENNIRLSIDMSTTDVEPQVLLGCADLFSLLEKGFSIQQTLPSGVQVVPSKLGYLVTGRKQEQKEKEEEERSLEKNDHTSDVLMLEAGYEKMTTNGEHESDGITTPSPRYDFRPRKKTFGDSSHQDQSTISMTSLTTSLLIMSVFQLLLPTAAGHFQNPHNASIKCTDEGVELTSTNVKRYELCIENLCSIKENPPLQENLNIEPELTLHQYTVRWKTTDGKEVLMIEKTCAPAPFCQKINCWLCTANVLNPHCSPKAAIAAATIVIYLTTMSLYLAYQSLRFITRPCHITIRILFSLCMMCPSLLRCLFTLLKEGKRRRYAENRTRYDVSSILDTPIIAITIVGIVCQTEACQEINVFTHHTKSCSLSPKGGQLCKITLNEVLKLNTFNQEACIRLISNKTMIQELRFKWRGLHLKEHYVYTTYETGSH
ncbi:zinc knuckle [Ostertagia ostertagi]